jgi:Rrf2 family transcriptional regulator, iron-sulfur cluster assembly transcription factor
MPLIFSKLCQYALRAILLMATYPPETCVNIRDMAGELQIPYHMLAKLCQDLVKRGLLLSTKGPGGGFALAQPPENIRLIDVVDAVDGVGITKQCALGLPNCSDDDPCSLHGEWGPIRESIVTMLNEKSVQDFAADLMDEEKAVRL